MTHPFAIVADGELVAGEYEWLLVPWWSFTKTILAAAALVLVHDGRLELDAPAAEKPYTLRQLLKHTAGLACYSELKDYRPAVEGPGDPWPAEEMLARVEAGRQRFEPGAMWKYSNLGYFYVRRLIEQATGDDIGRALSRLVLRPLEIDGAELATGPGDMARTAWGNPTSYHPGWVYHGLLIGPPIAAALALDGLLRGRLLPPALLAEMQRPVRLGRTIAGRPGIDVGYGLGLMMGAEGFAGRSVGHTGQDVTSVAAVYHFPDRRPAPTVAVFARGDDCAQVEWAAVNHALSSGA